MIMNSKWVEEAMLQGLGHLLAVTPEGFAVGRNDDDNDDGR